MSSLQDPFDLLETDSKVVPILPKSKLNAMVDHALTHGQMKRVPHASVSPFGMWSGGFAAAICAAFAFLFLTPSVPTIEKGQVASTVHAAHTQLANEDADEFADLIVLDTLESL